VREFELAVVAHHAIADLRGAHEGLHDPLWRVSEDALLRYQHARDALVLALRRGDALVGR
jgi:hypothetical protein